MGLRLPARLFVILNRARGWRIDSVVIQSAGLFGGGKAQIYQAEPQPAELDVAGVISYAAAWGYRGDRLIETVDDVLLFEEQFLKLARGRAREKTKELNR